MVKREYQIFISDCPFCLFGKITIARGANVQDSLVCKSCNKILADISFNEVYFDWEKRVKSFEERIKESKVKNDLKKELEEIKQLKQKFLIKNDTSPSKLKEETKQKVVSDRN